MKPMRAEQRQQIRTPYMIRISKHFDGVQTDLIQKMGV